jgi:hypothetical protein
LASSKQRDINSRDQHQHRRTKGGLAEHQVQCPGVSHGG